MSTSLRMRSILMLLVLWYTPLHTIQTSICTQHHHVPCNCHHDHCHSAGDQPCDTSAGDQPCGVIDCLDINQNGEVSFHELLAALAHVVNSLEPHTLQVGDCGELSLHEAITATTNAITNIATTGNIAGIPFAIAANISQTLTHVVDLALEVVHRSQIPTTMTLNELRAIFESEDAARSYIKNAQTITQVDNLANDKGASLDKEFKQTILTSVMNMLGNLANILADPRDRHVVAPNIANMLAQVLNIAASAKKTGDLSPEVFTPAVEKCLRSNRSFIRAFRLQVIEQIGQLQVRHHSIDPQ